MTLAPHAVNERSGLWRPCRSRVRRWLLALLHLLLLLGVSLRQLLRLLLVHLF